MRSTTIISIIIASIILTMVFIYTKKHSKGAFDIDQAASGNRDSMFCLKIDTLLIERKGATRSNQFANHIIPELENISKIESSSGKGTYGYLYNDDSTFNNDIEKWKNFFQCK